MNGAAMNCRQDQVLHSQHRDSGGLRDARYHLQMNHPCEQNFLPHHSKAINSHSDKFLVDGSSECLERLHTFDTTPPASGDIHDPRSQVRWTQMRKPIDLPVPKFEKDENCVAVTDNANPNLSHDNLDLDTRIDLLIKSKALAGMHPIFSELVESEDDSDDSLIMCPKKVSMSKKRKSLSTVETIFYQDKDDDLDKPLSRPPSPFLSRATYLFWFNKAIELKEQAKAQEQALLEKATKKCQDNLTPIKPNHVEKSARENKSFFGSLLNEISKEMKEMIKQQFINEVLESTISNSLESWWGTEFVQQEQQKLLVEHHKSNPTSKERNKNISDGILLCDSSEKIVSDCMRSTSVKHVPSKLEVFEYREKLFNEDDSSFNQTYDKEQHNLNLNRCHTLIQPNKSNISSIDRCVSKESLTTATSVRSHINNKSKNKHENLISDEKQDEICVENSSIVKTEHIKAVSPVSTHIASNTSLPQDQVDGDDFLTPMDTADNSDLAVRDRKSLEVTHPLKIVDDKSSKHETNNVSQSVQGIHAFKIAIDKSSKLDSSLIIANADVIDEECSNSITSVPSQDKQYTTGNNQSYLTEDIDETEINQILCQDTIKETILTDNKIKVQKYPENSVPNEEDTIMPKPNCEDAMESAVSSHDQD